MAKFVIGTPIETTEPTVEVTVDPQTPLRVGRHRFQLVVTDDSGNQSLPDTAEISAGDRRRAAAGGTDFTPWGRTIPAIKACPIRSRSSSETRPTRRL